MPIPDPLDPIQTAECCQQAAPAPDHHHLLKALDRGDPAHRYRLVRQSGDWYRLGGVVDADGHRLSDDLLAWGEAEYAARGEDVAVLAGYCRSRRLSATRWLGQTLHLVTPVAPGAAGFVQLDVEETHEVLHRRLGEHEPQDLDALLDPPGPPREALGPAHYHLRRLTVVPEFLDAWARHHGGPTRVHRLLDAWDRSSAARAVFCEHWHFAFRDFTGDYGEPLLSASPRASRRAALPRIDLAGLDTPLALSQALRRFDRQAGYPFAWFFGMVVGETVATAVGQRVLADLGRGYRYLAEADIAVLEAWRQGAFV